MALVETPFRIEPCWLEDHSPALSDAISALSMAGGRLGSRLHPRTAASLADLVRIMNSYYSNLIEGHNTRPRDIERALAADLDSDENRRNLQLEARAHVRVQQEIERRSAAGNLPEPASIEFLRWAHREFYKDAPGELLRIEGAGRTFVMTPGEFRSLPEHDVAVGRHAPPASARVEDFMRHFEQRYRLAGKGAAQRIVAMAAAHHRLNFVHPFPDGNGRVSRLMSHAIGLSAGIGAHGLWSVSRGLARGLESRGEYKRMMDHADAPRQGDLDGRGNLSLRALQEFVGWFVRICLDQVTFMEKLFDLDQLAARLYALVERDLGMRAEAFRLLEHALLRGEFPRGEAARIMGVGERLARSTLAGLIEQGLLGSETPKGPVSLRFPTSAAERLFPQLYPQT
jgi:Fic family protein